MQVHSTTENKSLPKIPMILPGQTIGILGGGQLGKMLAMTAQRLGYQVAVFCPETDAPAKSVSHQVFSAPYTDQNALAAFAKTCDMITYEFENIPNSSVLALEKTCPVLPQPSILATTQNRLKEKQFLAELGISTTPFCAVAGKPDLIEAVRKIGFPLVLKTNGSGYDGKGQQQVSTMAALETAYEHFAREGSSACIAEAWVPLEKELSVVVARSADNSGQLRCYPVTENLHSNHILDKSLIPADIPDAIEKAARETACEIAMAFQLFGLICIEFFLTRDGKLLVNEIAPRPHNSGHYTIEATKTSQFEQQLRAICSLPLGDTDVKLGYKAAGMMNLLGDRWLQEPEQESSDLNAKPAQLLSPRWHQCFSKENNVFLHLYGKQRVERGRKMGHITVLGASRGHVLKNLSEIEAQLFS
ncbi:MAG: 5-(carboxyamino)imidazole ribonucleotide synthase [Cyanobacteria bacterium P01_H01_bin.74]